MSNKKCFKDYFYAIDDLMSSKTRRRMNKKSHKGRWYGGVSGNQSGGDGGGDGAAGESVNNDGAILNELLGGVIPGTMTANILTPMRANMALGRRAWNMGYENHPETEEELEATATKFDVATGVFNSLVANPNMTRRDIINAMIQRAGVTESTAVSYYERIARAAGLTNADVANQMGSATRQQMVPGSMGQQGQQIQNPQGQQNPLGDMPAGTDMENDLNDQVGHTFDDNPNRQGIIRFVKNAHLIYKRQMPDGTFDELWIYKISKELKDELSIKKKILSGTDIPPSRTRSTDGKQTYKMWTKGNASVIHIQGLPS